MVIDSSALIAIIENEPERRPFEQSIRMASTRLLGAAGLFEASIVVLSRRREEGRPRTSTRPACLATSA